MELETINKLYLELSQVATAVPEKELLYKEALQRIRKYRNDDLPDGNGAEMRKIADETLRRAELR
jgi:hypothetical protein